MPNNQEKILIVDDDPGNLKSIMKCLVEENYNLLYAVNGLAALDVAEKELPDLIIMDWAMPLMNGLEAIKKLKSNVGTFEIPVIITSGMMTEAKDIQFALESGAEDYIKKPFDALELKARVRASLRTRNALLEIRKKNTEIASLLEKERDHHQRELTLYAVYEHEKNEMLISLRDQLRQLTGSAEKIDKGIKEVIKQVEQGITNEKSWDTFVTHFESVHPDFIKNLKQQHPTLTPNDLRISSYIKIGMDNKEIAQIAGLRVGSVRSNINRLKKRMSLGASDSIRDYLLQK